MSTPDHGHVDWDERYSVTEQVLGVARPAGAHHTHDLVLRARRRATLPA